LNFLVWHKLETCASKEENVMAQVGNLRQQRGKRYGTSWKLAPAKGIRHGTSLKLAPAKKNGLSLSEN